jgi:hypothetical protein
MQWLWSKFWENALSYCVCLVFPPCCKPRIESTPTEHEIYSASSCSVRSATSVQCNFSTPTSHLHVPGVQCALVKQLQFASCHVVCHTQNYTELASTPPISPCDQRVLRPPIWHCPLPPFSNPIADTRSQPVQTPSATMYKYTNCTVVLEVRG